MAQEIQEPDWTNHDNILGLAHYIAKNYESLNRK